MTHYLQSLRLRGAALYEDEVSNFATLLEDNPSLAYQRYGFTMIYGLEDEELVRERQRLGYMPVMAVDYYNLGVLANRDDNHAKAAEYYVKAIERGFALPHVHYNLALSYEHLGRPADARTAYQAFIEALKAKAHLSDEDRNDLSEVEARLAAL